MNRYEETINSSKLVLVEFFATWCPHCQRMMPVVREAEEDLDGVAAVFQFDIDKNRDLAEGLGVETIPTFIVYKDGEEMWRRSGEIDLDELEQVVKSFDE